MSRYSEFKTSYNLKIMLKGLYDMISSLSLERYKTFVHS